MTAFKILAPAKLNLTLEVLGRRNDGYHEIRSVLTTVTLFDEVAVEPGCGFVASAGEGYDARGLRGAAGELNSVELALALMVAQRNSLRGLAQVPQREALNQGLSEVALRLHKLIPAAAGLGGGASDGAAALRQLNEYWQLHLSDARLALLAQEIGSDCPFFLHGGTQLAGGRGEVLKALPNPAPAWFCVVWPRLVVPRKTARLYSLLSPEHFSSGRAGHNLAQKLRQSQARAIEADDLMNVFDQVSDQAYPGLDPIRAILRDCGAQAVHLCGAGPSLYGLYEDEELATHARGRLVEEGYSAWSVRTAAEWAQKSR